MAPLAKKIIPWFSTDRSAYEMESAMSETATTAEAWARFCARLKASVGQDAFNMWLARLQFEYIHNKTLTCSLPTTSLWDWARKHYQEILDACLHAEFPELERVRIVQRQLGVPILPPSPPKPKPDENIGSPHKNNYAPIEQPPVVPNTKKETGSQTLPLETDSWVDSIIKHVSKHSLLPFEEIISRMRYRELNEARAIAVFLVRTITRLGWDIIAKKFNRSVMMVNTYYSNVSGRTTQDVEFAYKLATLEAQIRRRELA